MTRKRHHNARQKQLERQAAREGRVLADGTIIPQGAIAADLAQQAPNNSWLPVLYYEDQPFTCADCGAEGVWTAEQQKWYFEVVKGSIYGRAKCCRDCRRKRRESQLPKDQRSS